MPKITVIGAGLSGLTTAYRLHQQGFDVDVYEARNRVGGRVFSVKIGDEIGELGGKNFAGGGDATHSYNLIQELGLELIEHRNPKPDYCYINNNNLINVNQAMQAYNISPEALDQKLKHLAANASSMHDVLQQLFSNDPILYDVYRSLLAAYEGSDVTFLSPRYITTLYHMLLGGWSSVHPHDEPGVLWAYIKGGNNLLAQRLAEQLQGNVHLNSPLTAVTKGASGSYLLTFASGEQQTTDILILTMPCSVYHDIAFTTDVIPADRLATLQAIQYGTNAKILVPIVTPPHEALLVISHRAILGSGYQKTHAILYYIGAGTHFNASTIDAVFARDRAIVEQAYTLQPLSDVPTCAKDEQFAHYAGPVAHSWPGDPYAQGSYSCIGAGQEITFTQLEECAGEQVKTLFAPINNTLFFAGEHTCINMDICGTMEAAIESGERTARIIATLRSINV